MLGESEYLSDAFAPHLSHGDLRLLLRPAHKIAFSKKESVFLEGDPSRNALMITRGQVKLFRLSENGREVIFRFSGVGEIIGLAELLSNSSRKSNAEAQVMTEAYAIPRGALLTFMQDRPEVALRAIGVLSARVRSLEEAMTNLASESVEMRLRRLLLRMTVRKKAGPDGKVRLEFPYTHQDVANQIGASRQTVSTIFSDLKRRGVIESIDRTALLFNPLEVEVEVEY